MSWVRVPSPAPYNLRGGRGLRRRGRRRRGSRREVCRFVAVGVRRFWPRLSAPGRFGAAGRTSGGECITRRLTLQPRAASPSACTVTSGPLGGYRNTAQGSWSTLSGGLQRTSTGTHDWRSAPMSYGAPKPWQLVLFDSEEHAPRGSGKDLDVAAQAPVAVRPSASAAHEQFRRSVAVPIGERVE